MAKMGAMAMPFEYKVSMMDGTKYAVKRLLSKGKNNLKTSKSDKAQTTYRTISLSLAPSRESGFNLCTSASKGCISSCIHTSGNAMIWPKMVKDARIAKARLFKFDPSAFKERLLKELTNAQAMADLKGYTLAFRPNVFSDVFWEREMPELFTKFPKIQFYDYTKHVKRMERYLQGKLPSNYHLTFSRSETNEADCRRILDMGGTVAVAFNLKGKKSLPLTYLGFEVINGDETDLRFLDGKSRVIGLKAKGKGRSDKTGFIVTI